MRYVYVKKEILISSFISIVLLVVGIFFINSSHKKVAQETSRDWYVIKCSGVEYPLNLAVPKYTTYLDAIAEMNPVESMDHIYRKVSKEWEEVDKNDYITKDETLKIS